LLQRFDWHALRVLGAKERARPIMIIKYGDYEQNAFKGYETSRESINLVFLPVLPKTAVQGER